MGNLVITAGTLWLNIHLSKWVPCCNYIDKNGTQIYWNPYFYYWFLWITMMTMMTRTMSTKIRLTIIITVTMRMKITMTMKMTMTMTMMMSESQICPPLPTLLFQCGLYALFTIYKPARQFNVQHLLSALNPPLTPPQSVHCLRGYVRSTNRQIIWENQLVRGGRLYQAVILRFLNRWLSFGFRKDIFEAQFGPNLGGFVWVKWATKHSNGRFQVIWLIRTQIPATVGPTL